MRVPHEELQPETLRNLVEHFIAREGTDYGAHEVSLEAKVAQVMRQLAKGEAAIVYDEESESCNIIPLK